MYTAIYFFSWVGNGCYKCASTKGTLNRLGLIRPGPETSRWPDAGRIAGGEGNGDEGAGASRGRRTSCQRWGLRRRPLQRRAGPVEVHSIYFPSTWRASSTLGLRRDREARIRAVSVDDLIKEGNISGANQPLHANCTNFNLDHQINIQGAWVG
jgi:hypothetical protein